MAIVEKLHVLKFRNLTDQCLLPSKNINVLIGKNGQGKTNFIESLYYLGHGRSFKTKNLKDVIPFDDQQIQISAVIDGKKITINKSREKRLVLIDGKKISSNSVLSQILPTQIISPDRGFVVGGPPKLKRSYLDWGVFHHNEKTLRTYASYKKTLKNINSLLVSGNRDQLGEWLTKFASLSVEITKERNEYISKLTKTLNKNISHKLISLVGHSVEFVFVLQTGWPKEVDAFSQKKIETYLLNNTNTFFKSKHLSYGPHRSSIDYFLNGQSENFMSRGEQKKMSIVFWMLQIFMLVENEKKPIVLVDDISSELDNIKIKSIVDYLSEIKVQIFITDIGNKKLPLSEKNTTNYKIESGVIAGLKG
jgi:DNA replication and repair protein RecF